jgi:fatty-acyl-CoA synthase
VTGTVQACLRSREQDRGIAIKAGDRTWTWTEYVGQAAARANAVQELLDPQRPPHVGLLFDNTVEMVLALASGALAGYVSVGLNLTRRGSGLRADILRADCQVLLTDHRYRPLLAGLDLTGVRVVDTGGPEWAALVQQHCGPVREPRAVADHDPFMLIFTSGTSGTPKAVPVSNFMVTMSGGNLVDRFGLGPEDTCYLSMPLFHSNAVLAGYAVAVRSGAAMALAERFSASTFLSDVRRYGATYMNYVGKPLAYVLRTPSRPDDADNPLRVAFGNEASDRDIASFSERFGVTVWDGFGSTESAVIITREPGTPPGSIGLPWDGVTVYDRFTRTECPRAVFDATGRVTNLEQAVGELVNTAGAGFFQGYYNDPEATGQRMDGGIYWSGDLAYRDQAGYVYLAGRTGDWLRVDGENLAAGIIEQILLRHPAVSQVAVYGIPDPLCGDQLVAALVLNGDTGLDPVSFGQFLAGQEDLSPKGWPGYVRLTRELPSTATNKVLKRELVRQGLDFTDPCWIRAERGRDYRSTRGRP